jgi:hypothetical protein
MASCGYRTEALARWPTVADEVGVGPASTQREQFVDRRLSAVGAGRRVPAGRQSHTKWAWVGRRARADWRQPH